MDNATDFPCGALRWGWAKQRCCAVWGGGRMVAGLEERRWGNILVGSLVGSRELGSGLRREVMVVQEDIRSGLGNIVPVDWGLIH